MPHTVIDASHNARARAKAVAVGGALFVITLAVRGFQLGRPAMFVYDEVFYVNDALDLVLRGVERTRVGHPPLGKWLIGLGFAFTHLSPTTWRASALVAGAVVVVLVFASARRITGSIAMGAAAALLVLSDGIANAAGRYALLDGFVSLLTTALLATLIFTSDRRMDLRLALLVGGLSGAALATKWSALPPLAIVVVIIFSRASRASTVQRGVAMVGAAAGAGVLVFVATYTPWIVTGRSSGNCAISACHSNAVRRVSLLPRLQRQMLESDATIKRQNRQLRPGWTWVTQQKAMQLFKEPCRGIEDSVCRRGSDDVVLVAIRGNRILWVSVWPALAAWLYVRRRRGRGADGVGLAAVWALALWVPWIALSRTFLYYAAPMVPALAIGLIGSLDATLPPRVRPIVVTAVVAAAVLTLVVTQPAAPWRA